MPVFFLACITANDRKFYLGEIIVKDVRSISGEPANIGIHDFSSLSFSFCRKHHPAAFVQANDTDHEQRDIVQREGLCQSTDAQEDEENKQDS
jgi:hypothetical protein